MENILLKFLNGEELTQEEHQLLLSSAQRPEGLEIINQQLLEVVQQENQDDKLVKLLKLGASTECVIAVAPTIFGVPMPELTSNYTPLQIACLKGNNNYVMRLLDAGCSDEDKDEGLHRASSKGHIECMKLLLDAGCSEKAKLNELRSAAINGDIERIKLLLDAGCSERATNEGLRLTSSNGHIECMKLLLDAGCPEANLKFDFYNASKNGHTNCIKLLLDARCSDEELRSLFHAAGHSENLNDLELWRIYGGNIDSVMTGIRKATYKTDLYQANTPYVEHMSKFLIELGTPICAGTTMTNPVDYSICDEYLQGNISLLRLLCTKGANVNLLFSNDRVPLVEIVVRQGNANALKILLELGANANIAVGGQTLIEYAQYLGRTECVQLLQDAQDSKTDRSDDTGVGNALLDETTSRRADGEEDMYGVSTLGSDGET